MKIQNCQVKHFKVLHTNHPLTTYSVRGQVSALYSSSSQCFPQLNMFFRSPSGLLGTLSFNLLPSLLWIPCSPANSQKLKVPTPHSLPSPCQRARGRKWYASCFLPCFPHSRSSEEKIDSICTGNYE